jgi:hypothetical protein
MWAGVRGGDRGAGLWYGNAGAAGERAGCLHLTQVVTKNGEAGAGVGIAAGIAGGIRLRAVDTETTHSLTSAAVGMQMVPSAAAEHVVDVAAC